MIHALQHCLLIGRKCLLNPFWHGSCYLYAMPLALRLCHNCSREFTPKRRNQLYCDKVCREDFFWRTHVIIQTPLADVPQRGIFHLPVECHHSISPST